MKRRHSSAVTSDIISVEYVGIANKLKSDELIELQFEKEDGAVLTDTGPRFGKRHIQILAIFLMVFLNQNMRQHISLTLVAMTDPTANNNETSTFDSKYKNVILSCFFWGYIVALIFAGWLVTRYGMKWFVILCTALTSLTGFLIPCLAVQFGATPVIVCRILQGICQSFVVSSVPYFFSRWVPASERARWCTFVLTGNTIGFIVSMLVSGPIAASIFGWPMVFYIFSFFGSVWCVFYYFLGYNSPIEHKSITEEEKLYIIRNAVNPSKIPQVTPWRKILTSLPFFALLYSYTACMFIGSILLSQIPSYINKIMKYDIKSNGFLTALIFVTEWLESASMSFLSDYLANRNYLSTTSIRKIFTALGSTVPAVALIFLAQCSAENSVRGVVLLMFAAGAGGASMCSICINTVDISPDHAGVVQGIIEFVAHIFVMLAPLFVQLLVVDESDPDQWKNLFYIASAVGFSSTIIFAIFGTARRQEWNNLEEENNF